MMRTALAALYLLSIPGASAWAQAARAAEAPPSAPIAMGALPLALSGSAAEAPGLTAASMAPSLRAAAPNLSAAPALAASAAPASAPAPAASAAAVAAAADEAATPFAAAPAAAPAPRVATFLSNLRALIAGERRGEAAAAIAGSRLFDGGARAVASDDSLVARAQARSAAASLKPSTPRAPKLRGYLAGAFMAQLASNSQQVTMPLIFLKMTGAASSTAFLLAAGSALDAVGTLIGGRMTDRWGAKPVLLSSTVARGLAVAALPALAAGGALTLPAVAAAYAVESFCRGLADTARSTLPSEVAGADEAALKTVLARNQTALESGALAGPFVAGGLIAAMGGAASTAALLVAPIAFALVAAAYLTLPRRAPIPAASDASASNSTPARLDGWKAWALACAALLTVYPLKGLLPAVFATQILHSQTSAAWLTGMFGVGGLLGALAYGRFSRERGARGWIAAGAGGVALLGAAFLPGAFLPAAAGILLFAATNTAARLALSAEIQRRAEPGRAGALMGPARFAANATGLAIRLLAGLAFGAALSAAGSFAAIAGGLGVTALALGASALRLTRPVSAAAMMALSPAAPPRLSPVHGMPGRLIVVEGLDGSGKSTQMQRLKEDLESRGVEVVETSWNSSDLASEAVKKAKKARALDPRTFALMNAADLSDRLDKVVLPALRSGAVVLADRWFFTALARDSVRGNDPRWLRSLYENAPRPDLTLYFRLPVEAAISRVMSRAGGGAPRLSEDFDEDSAGKVLGQNYYAVGRDQNFSPDDLENFREFQTRVAASYDAQMREFGLRPIDASKDRDAVAAAVGVAARRALGDLSSFKRRDAAPKSGLFDKDPAGDADNIRRNYMKEKRGAHFYFRNMLLPMQERFAELMDMAAMPRVLLHGSPHVDNYAKSSRGAAMVDFDRSRVGPYAWDLLRLMVSLSLRRKKPDEDLLDKSVLKQLKKGYLHGLRHPDRPFSEARLLKDAEPGPGEESVDAYLKSGGKWAAEMRRSPLPASDPDVVALVEGYDRSLGGGLLERYRIEEAGRGRGSMGFRGLFLVVLAPKDPNSGLDRILLNIKQVRSDPDTRWYTNPYPSEIARMHAASSLYAPDWAQGEGSATLDGVEYDVRRIDPLNAKIKKMLTLDQQADLAYAVGTQLGRAHRLSLQDGTTESDLENALERDFGDLVEAGRTIRDELLSAHTRYLKRMKKAGLTPPPEGDDAP